MKLLEKIRNVRGAVAIYLKTFARSGTSLEDPGKLYFIDSLAEPGQALPRLRNLAERL